MWLGLLCLMIYDLKQTPFARQAGLKRICITKQFSTKSLIRLDAVPPVVLQSICLYTLCFQSYNTLDLPHVSLPLRRWRHLSFLRFTRRITIELIDKKNFVAALPSLSHGETPVSFLGRKLFWSELAEPADYGDRKKMDSVLGISVMGL
jgi:hypothetical protein